MRKSKKNEKVKKNVKKRNNKKPSFSLNFSLPEEIKRYLSGLLFLLLLIFFVLSFFQKGGALGEFLISFSRYLFGFHSATFFLPIFLFLTGLSLFFSQYKKIFFPILISFFLIVFGASLLFESLKFGGGILGKLLTPIFFKILGPLISQILFSISILPGFWLFFVLLKREREPKEVKPSLLKRIFSPSFKIERVCPTEEKKVITPPEKKEVIIKKAETLEFEYERPPLDLLEKDKGHPLAGDIRQNSLIIKKTLENFGIKVEMGEVNVGPTVTQYTLKPADGVKLSKITSLSNDLALALAAHPIRIEAPIPGKSLVGIEVPNKVRTIVRLRDLISLTQFQNSPSPLTFVLGRDVSGNPAFADLARMPHLLVAGATGTGKTCAADTLLFSERGLLTFEELCPLPLNSEADLEIKVVTRDGIETTKRIYNNGICQFYKISTKRGYQIEVTAEHPLWVMNEDGSEGWKQAALIKEGDYVAISRGPALFGSKVDLSNFKPSKIKDNTKKISFPSQMSPQLAQFLGLLAADGGLSIEKKGIHRVVFTQADPELLSLYKNLLKELFGIDKFIERVSGSNPNNKAKDIIVNSKHLKEFLSFLGVEFVKSPQKTIPRAIREAPREIIVHFLKALFDADGYVTKEGIEICLSSQKLALQVQILLLNFGIISSLREKKVKNYSKNKYFRLSIYGQDCRKFIKEIGFIRKKKYEKIEKVLNSLSNPNLDVVPHLSLLLKTLAKKYLGQFARLTNKGWQYQHNVLIPKYDFPSLRNYNLSYRAPSYSALEKILNFYQPISEELEYQKLLQFYQRNFYWDRVERIEKTSGVGYDFYVPGSDSFVGNGFVNHNTIFLNSLILSLIYRNSPQILNFILIDPKRVEFPVYNDLPHVLNDVIFDVQKTVNALKWLVEEMERRFETLAQFKTRDILAYNTLAFQEKLNPMPYVVLIIDELADLMAARGREIEAGIVRLAQMARAVGIHLVLATQRPSTEVITGLIKANITARITFQVASQVDSRTVIDTAGAEKLLGMGDLLFVSAENPKPKRIQGSFVSDKEVKRVVEFLSSKYKGEKRKITSFEEKLSEEFDEGIEFLEKGEFEDPLYEEAKKIVIQAKKASASLLQRRLKIGYARAARLLDILEERGVIGPPQGAKPREVYLKENGEWKKI